MEEPRWVHAVHFLERGWDLNELGWAMLGL